MSTRTLPPRTLTELQTDLTRRLILDTAMEILERHSVSELTAREVAKKAGISERTIFRYFSNRNEFLESVAKEVIHRAAIPPAPSTIEDLLAYPKMLFETFERNENLIKASLHSELFPKIRDTQGKKRWEDIGKLLDRDFPSAPAKTRKIAATNIRFVLSAMSWNYYRVYFDLSFNETIACVQTVVRESLKGIGWKEFP